MRARVGAETRRHETRRMPALQVTVLGYAEEDEVSWKMRAVQAFCAATASFATVIAWNLFTS